MPREPRTGGAVPAGARWSRAPADALGQRRRAGRGRHAAGAERLRVRGACARDAGALEVALRSGGKAPLTVRRLAVPAGSAVPSLRFGAERPPTAGSTLPVPDAPRPSGRFTRIAMNSGLLRAVPVYTAEGLPVRLVER
ncbi:hypothetical protein [Streptomyces sp. NPDC001851]|uniref:hypothetical protein n=1 Tax=Streptomyces sp. NPDC001851 TaxID=3154529 RepID=UPI00332F5F73